MKRYILSPEAKTDIINIRKYTTRQWGKAKTEKYTLQLGNGCNALRTIQCLDGQEMK
jgi:plasmid stabilization system protein ParE